MSHQPLHHAWQRRPNNLSVHTHTHTPHLATCPAHAHAATQAVIIRGRARCLAWLGGAAKAPKLVHMHESAPCHAKKESHRQAHTEALPPGPAHGHFMGCPVKRCRATHSAKAHASRQPSAVPLLQRSCIAPAPRTSRAGGLRSLWPTGPVVSAGSAGLALHHML